jgi:hypothetical protein
MTDNEKELLNIIRNHNNPKQAIEIAINLMIDFSKKLEAPQDTFSVHPRVSV